MVKHYIYDVDKETVLDKICSKLDFHCDAKESVGTTTITV